MRKYWTVTRAFVAVCVAVASCILALVVLGAQPQPSSQPAAVRPEYDESRALRLPASYREWIVAGSSLGLNYSATGGGTPLFHQVLIEPTAYRHFVATGELRDGTMFALLLQRPASGVLPGRRGEFAGDLQTVEMAVKDSSRVRATAQPQPRANCHACHVEHAQRDHVFLQFYPLLAQAAAARAASANKPLQTSQEHAPLALKGLDPVLLTEGREEIGKAEIVEVHEGRQYQFLSEPTHARFRSDPERFSIQNETCPVVPGAPVDLALFAVHEGRIYAFATENCVTDFKADPPRYIKPQVRVVQP